MAIPPPMVPEPIMPTLLIVRGLISLAIPGIRVISLSAKKICLNALASVVLSVVSPISFSCLIPSLKSFSIAAWIALIKYSGAWYPRINFAARFLQSSTKSLSYPSVSISIFEVILGPEFESSNSSAYANASSILLLSRTRSTIPRFSASAALTGFVSIINFNAFFAPIKRGKRWVPPAPGIIPNVNSGNPSFASAVAHL